MLKPNVEKLLNEQVVKEFYSSFLYLSMAAYFSEKGLDGFAKWFRVQAEEERAHAMILYYYILKAGGAAEIGAIDKPETGWRDIRHILERTLTHEQSVTESIYNLSFEAQKEKDLKTFQLLQWFVDEQGEEEENASKNLARFDLMGADGKALYLLDQELGARVFAAPPLLAQMET